ncbi:MAG: alpha/beta hydrolase [Bacteroidota bacterium]|nr:alpha/beta hydrolase [Bacteroidota bacterium]
MEIPHLKIDGKGLPFVWLHGMLNSVESDSVYSLIDFDQLSKQVSVVRYNYCDKSVTGNYCWDALTEELIRIADAQNFDSMILGGSSMGAGIAIHAAVRFPERVKALILVTPPPAWEERSDVKKIYKKIASKASPYETPDFLKKLISQNQDTPYFIEQKHRGTRQRLLDYRLGFDPAYYSRIYNGGAASDFPSPEEIAKIKVPTLIAGIPDDTNHPLEMAWNLELLIPGSESVVVWDYDEYLKFQEKIHDFICRITPQ